MSGLVSKNVIYLKVDEKNRPDFEARGLAPFTYKRNGKDYFMSYHEVPYQTMDDAEELCKWGKKLTRQQNALLRASWTSSGAGSSFGSGQWRSENDTGFVMVSHFKHDLARNLLPSVCNDGRSGQAFPKPQTLLLRFFICSSPAFTSHQSTITPWDLSAAIIGRFCHLPGY